jgi:hypothetical protein
MMCHIGTHAHRYTTGRCRWLSTAVTCCATYLDLQREGCSYRSGTSTSRPGDPGSHPLQRQVSVLRRQLLYRSSDRTDPSVTDHMAQIGYRSHNEVVYDASQGTLPIPNGMWPPVSPTKMNSPPGCSSREPNANVCRSPRNPGSLAPA